MNTHRPNFDILKQAAKTLHSNTGLKTEILEIGKKQGDSAERAPDAILKLLDSGKQYFVEIKRHAQHVNLGALIDHVKRLPSSSSGLLVADYINPRMAEKLKQADVQFIDTAGNTYINSHPVYIHITGRKQLNPGEHTENNTAKRAFEQKGLLVTFAFLVDPSIAAKSYREISRIAGVSVGTVGWVLRALKAGQYLHDESNTNKRYIINYQKLLDRWVSAWPEKLRHKYLLGKFTTQDPDWWKQTNIKNYEGYWGGETAAAIYTKHLQPQVATVYIPKDNFGKLIRDARLSKASSHEQERGNVVYLYSTFWNTIAHETPPDVLLHETSPRWSTNPETNNELVNPILAYADLIATGDPRNIETAQLLRDKYIVEPNEAT